MKLPKTGNILIPGISEKIKAKQKELNLKPEIPIDDFLKEHGKGKHRYFSPCLDKNGKKVAFYARLHFNLDAKRKIIREINFLEKLKKSRLKIKKRIPQIISFGLEKDFEWFIREYPPGLPLGKSRNLHQKLSSKLVPRLIEILEDISKIPSSFFPKIKKFKIEKYLAKKTYQELVKKGFIKKKIANSLERFIKRNISLLKKENKVFCHGDLNLGNLLVRKNEVWIIDWELIHLNNFAFDIGYFWTHLWEAETNFRQELIFSFLKKLSKEKIEKFKILFPIVVSYLALGGIKHKLKKRRFFYYQLLKNCLNFEKLIKL